MNKQKSFSEVIKSLLKQKGLLLFITSLMVFVPIIINSAPQDGAAHAEFFRNQFTPYIVGTIFVLLYALILSNRVTPALVTMFGALLFILLGFVPFKIVLQDIQVENLVDPVENVKTMVKNTAVESVDWNTLALLSGMMILVGILKSTGLFKFIAIKIVKIFKGDLVKIWVAFLFTTAIMSAFLDNVTTVLIIAPITLLLTHSVGISPAPLLITEVLAANVGGTATLIGDPPNILIGSAAGFSFVDFLVNLAPFIIVLLVLTIVIFYFMVRKEIAHKVKSDFDPSKTITNKPLLIKSVIVFGAVLVLFVLGHSFHLEPGPIALFGAFLIMILGRLDSEEWFKEIEWDIIFFFIGLFIMVKALDIQGILDLIGNYLISMTGGNLLSISFILIWFIGISASFFGAVPIVTTLIPIIMSVGQTLSAQAGAPVDIDVLWWSASLGACLGGNGTIFGTATGMVSVGLTKKMDEKDKVTFMKFFKLGYPITIVHLILSSLFIYIFYFVLK